MSENPDVTPEPEVPVADPEAAPRQVPVVIGGVLHGMRDATPEDDLQ